MTPAAPPNALLIWTNGRDIFVQLRGPVILRYALSEGGLSKALSLLRQHADYSGQPMLTPPKKPATLQDATAQSVLRRMGMIR